MVGEIDQNGGIALCLSGGGLRATLFHLGLIKALRSHTKFGKSALASVTEIYSVSGGSIAAAHLLRNWQSYVGADPDFVTMEKNIIAFSGRNIRDRVVRRWLLTRWAGGRRTYWLRKEYEHLLGLGAIADCYSQQAETPPPDIYILATSFQTGELCSFSKDMFEIVKRSPDGPTPVSVHGDHLSLAFAVAASSAFPPLFPPVALTTYMLGDPDGDEFDATLHLADGGVYDNFGIDKLKLNVEARRSSVTTMLISHAGGSFRSDQDRTYAGAFSRNIRASDIMMRRVGEHTEASAASIPGVDAISIRIGDFVKKVGVPPATQRRLRLVRTDLDRFEPELAKMLIDHGYRVAAAALAAAGWQRPDGTLEMLSSAAHETQERTAGQASKRTFYSLIFDFRDWRTTPILWAVALLVASGLFITVLKALDERAANERADAERSVRLNAQDEQLERIRAAYASRRPDLLEKELGLAIRATEELTLNPDLQANETTRQITAAQAKAIVSEAPSLRKPLSQSDFNQRVFIHFAGDLSRASVTALNNALRASGWRVEGASGERVAKAPTKNVVRYSGDNEKAALELADAINVASITPGRVEAQRFAGIGRNNLEVWIAE